VELLLVHVSLPRGHVLVMSERTAGASWPLPKTEEQQACQARPGRVPGHLRGRGCAGGPGIHAARRRERETGRPKRAPRDGV
jgi:hypothetical protein